MLILFKIISRLSEIRKRLSRVSLVETRIVKSKTKRQL
jgi:hypothetical protein